MEILDAMVTLALDCCGSDNEDKSTEGKVMYI